jgi:UDP-N-acetylglucosamine 4-epimerase
MLATAGAWPHRRVLQELEESPRTWLITGVAGFIGSNLLERLLANGQRVVGLDNFATGSQANLDEVMTLAASGRGEFRFIRGDIRDVATCRKAMMGVDYVLHHAALGSVPLSMNDPAETNSVNVDGFINILIAARDAEVKRVVYASTCAVYGDSPALPLSEDTVGSMLSPYAVSKMTNELYAAVFQRAYGLPVVGLRYFNIFGPRQDPNGAYAAVIPKWIDKLLAGERCEINGDGQNSRDFCHVANVAQANVLAATATLDEQSPIFNVACGSETSLNELYRMIRLGLVGYQPSIAVAQPMYRAFRAGDIRRSTADISRIREALQYEPTHSVAQGLGETLEWYVASRRATGQDSEREAAIA